MRTKITLLAYILLFTFYSALNKGQCTASGSLSGSAFANESSIGLLNWSNTPAVQVSDDNRASAGFLVGVLGSISTHYLSATGFNFSIPAGAVICGVEVHIEHREQGVTIGSSVRDNSVQLIVNGAITGNNMASASNWAGSDEIFTYGSASDNWGCSLAPADINSGNFGVAVSSTLRAGLAALFLTAEIDHITITVHYLSGLILPVKWLSFTAENKDNKEVALAWETLNENNNRHFIVEKSRDALNFVPVTTVPAVGNSTVPVAYNATDALPYFEQSYYRIKQVDLNGNFGYSQVRQVWVEPAAGVNVSSWPGHISIELNSNETVLAQLHLVNLQGEEVWSASQMVNEGVNEIRVSTFQISPGLFFLKATYSSKEYYRKIFVLKE